MEKIRTSSGYILIVISVVLAIPSVMAIDYDFSVNVYSLLGTFMSFLGALFIPAIPLAFGLILLRKTE